MRRISLDFEFDFWERVYHIADDKAMHGVVTGWCISQQLTITYRVAFGPGHEGWYFAEELTRDKPNDFEKD